MDAEATLVDRETPVARTEPELPEDCAAVRTEPELPEDCAAAMARWAARGARSVEAPRREERAVV